MSSSGTIWGKEIERTINFGREDRSSYYKKINPKDPGYEKFSHYSHVMIYAKTKSEFETFKKKAIVLMQMRYDGYIGFPGGVVEKGESPLQALCRELKEEINWSEEKGAVSENDFQFTYADEIKELVFHFYATEVTEKKILKIEKNMINAYDYGMEVLGNIRVPLFTMGDEFRGFPAFLRNNFIGNAKLQLIETVVNLKFLTAEEVIQALHSAPMITKL